MMDEDIIRHFSSLTSTDEYADIRIGRYSALNILMEDGKTKEVSESKGDGFGIRIYKQGRYGLASSTRLTKRAVEEAVEKARKLLRNQVPSRNKTKIEPEYNNMRLKPRWKESTEEVGIEEKFRVLRSCADAAKLKGISSVSVDYSDGITEWTIGSTAGNIVSFSESHPRLLVSSFVRKDGITQAVRKSIGGNIGFEIFRNNDLEKLGRTASTEALNLLDAKPVKGGRYDVVLDYSMTGVYTHEAFGHATEADGIVAGTSILEGKIGQRVGAEIVNIIDDPTIPGARGSFAFDQEGTKAKRRILVGNGVLLSYLESLETAGILDRNEKNGAARGMTPFNNPIPRMSNTFIAPGDFDEDIFEDIKLGVSFYGFQYGYTDPGSGKFMFKAQYGRMIRNGKLAEYVRDAALSGYTLDVLKRIDAVGRDMRLDDGTCGKSGQWVPVTSGGPDIRIRGVVVGGQ